MYRFNMSTFKVVILNHYFCLFYLQNCNSTVIKKKCDDGDLKQPISFLSDELQIISDDQNRTIV